jgi:CheY-like chemotaxis protein
MGGSLTVASTSPRGTCLQLTLKAATEDELRSAASPPAPAPDDPALAAASTAAPQAPCLRAVCVEDNPVNALLVKFVFAQVEGWQLEVFASAEAAREALADGRMALLLMDLQLPGESGISALQHLAVQPGAPRPHCAAVTADASADTRLLALASGFDSYLEKPLDLKQLRALIERVQRDHTVAAAP